MAIDGYYYLHANGDLIYKRNTSGILEDFANSDLVKHYWPVDTSDRWGAWMMLIEALAWGANDSRVSELAQKWGCNNEDAIIFAERSGIHLEQKDSEYRAVYNLDGEDYMGVGEDYLHAFADQLLEMKNHRTKQQRLMQRILR